MKYLPRHKIVLALLFFIPIFLLIVVFLRPIPYQLQIVLANKLFTVEVVDTDKLLEQGLSGRDSLSLDSGMLFDLGSADRHGFWMKDMNFAIDIIWIDGNWKVVHIEKSVSPETYPKVFYPQSPASFVLEILAGQSDKIGLKVGDIVKLVSK